MGCRNLERHIEYKQILKHGIFRLKSDSDKCTSDKKSVLFSISQSCKSIWNMIKKHNLMSHLTIIQTYTCRNKQCPFEKLNSVKYI